MRRNWLIIGGLAILSAAEMAGQPNPALKMRDTYQAQPETAGVTTDGAVDKWWSTLGDAELNALIERAAKSNLDLKLAEERLFETRAARRISRADLLPSLEANVSAQRLRGGFEDGSVHVGNSPGGNILISPFESNVYQGGFDASWEFDLFGGKRHALKAATAEVRASEETRRDVLVSLLGEVARNYVELRGSQRRLAITTRNIDLQRDSLHLTQVRADAGLGNQLDVARQQTQLETSEALAPTLDAQVRQSIHRLSVLMGEEPSALSAELQSAAPLPAVPLVVPVGLPGDLLKRRPDLRRAQTEITAAMERVGAAKADLFPKITLTGLMGRQSNDVGGLTLGLGNFFAVGPALTLPIFTGGRLKANIEVRKQQWNEAATTYESAVLNAVEEAENTLVAYGREKQRRDRLVVATQSSRGAAQLATELYTRGLSDFLSVLEAQRDLLSAEDMLAQSDTAVLTDLVALYKALGGGWNEIYPVK